MKELLQIMPLAFGVKPSNLVSNKIAVAGMGYVGLSIATLLAQHNEVVAVDVVPEKVDLINNHRSPIKDEFIEEYLAHKDLHLTATLDGESAYMDAQYVVIAVPTNYDPQRNYFDTSRVEEVIDQVLRINPKAVMIIKSTIPVGYSRHLYMKGERHIPGRASCRRSAHESITVKRML